MFALQEDEMRTAQAIVLAGALAAVGVERLLMAQNAAQKAADLVGTWKLVSATSVAGGKTNPAAYGVGAAGFVTYTPEGRMSVVISNGGRSPLSVADRVAAPAAERAQAFATFLAYAGRYSVSGDRVIHHIEAASIPNWANGDQVRFFRLDGDRLTIRTPPDYVYGGRTQTFELLLERLK